MWKLDGVVSIHTLLATFSFEISDLQWHGRDEDSRAFENQKWCCIEIETRLVRVLINVA